MTADEDWYWPDDEPEFPSLEKLLEVFGAAFAEIGEAFAPIAEACQNFASLIEESPDHHVVCEHKIKCKPPPKYAQNTRSTSQSRRPKYIRR